MWNGKRGFLLWASIILATLVVGGWIPLEVANGLKALLLAQ